MAWCGAEAVWYLPAGVAECKLTTGTNTEDVDTEFSRYPTWGGQMALPLRDWAPGLRMQSEEASDAAFVGSAVVSAGQAWSALVKQSAT